MGCRNAAPNERTPLLLSEKLAWTKENNLETGQPVESVEMTETWRPNRLFWICILAIYGFKVLLQMREA
jgi:hypothetical protein